MDGYHFDALTRSLTSAGSRRRALALALSGTLASLLAREDTDAHDALLTCKKLKGDKKKKCLKKAKRHMKTHARSASPGCTRNCAGKTCGDDGCGGSCGTCSFGTCNGASCVCPNDKELCRGRCEDLCSVGKVRHTKTCDCCIPAEGGCSPQGFSFDCCTNQCSQDIFGLKCVGRAEGSACNTNGECTSGLCTNDVCRCPSDKEACNGHCHPPCPAPVIRRPGGCDCCTPKGSSCSAVPCCSGTCDAGGLCTGLPNGATCTSNAQCADGLECTLVLNGNGARECTTPPPLP